MHRQPTRFSAPYRHAAVAVLALLALTPSAFAQTPGAKPKAAKPPDVVAASAQVEAALRLADRAGQLLAGSLKPGGPTAAELAALVKLANAFDSDLGLLRPAGADDATLRDMLSLIDGQWLFVRQALSRPRERARTKIEDVGRASELMFEVIDREMQRQRRRT